MEAILIGIIIVLVAVIVIMAIKWPQVIEVSDSLPKTQTERGFWMKLQNEGAKYIKVKKDRVTLKIVK